MPVYSHSRLSSFEKCPLQYRYRYIDRIKRDTQGIEAFMGNRVHEVLEKLYGDLGKTKHNSVDELLAFYRSAWDANYSDKVKIVKTEYTADYYRQVGERCIVNYYQRHDPFEDGVTVGLEERVQMALDEGGRYLIQGYIDRLARAGPEVYEIHDYKTSSSLPSAADLRKDRQLTLYRMAVAKKFPGAKEIRLIWHYLAFDQVLVSDRTPGEIEGHRRKTIELIDTVEAAKEYPPHESALCRWCEYRNICPVQKHLVKAEAPPRNESPKGEGAVVAPFKAEQLDLFS